MSASPSAAAPVTQSERIVLLDSLRGIAILGILLMNISSFAQAPILHLDPMLLNEQGINYYVWLIVFWLLNGTQRALFSMLFGAGVILFVGRQEQKLDGLAAADYFFRRQMWLIAISLFDVFVLLWNGDILLDYACYGMLIFTFRKSSPKFLIIAASVCLVFMIARENRDLYQEKEMIQRGESVAAIDTLKVKLNDKQKAELEDMNTFKKSSTKESRLKNIDETNEIVQGEYAGVYKWRTESYTDTIVQYIYLELWDVLIFMFLGMAFFKLGILTGDAPVRWYALIAIIGLGLGVPLSYFRVQSVIDNQFNSFEILKSVHISFYQIERTLRSLGLFGVIILLYKSGIFGWLFSLMRPTGQMALTNYLAQSLICGFIFNGYGLGLFGKMQRYEVYLVVLAIWVFQVVYSNIWMRLYFYGPCEWVWRSLTYWRPQPFKR
ncbi:MAG: DUF418 domain-containing protein [Chryseolinea sp.]